MSLFVESPWPAVTICALAFILFGTMFVSSGRPTWLGALAATMVVLVVLVGIERFVVTTAEEIEDTLHGVAAKLEQNNRQEVLASFSVESPRLREAESILQRVTVQSAIVGRDLDIRINKLTSPVSASASFTGRFQVRDKSGSIPYEHIIRKFKIRLERHDDRWLIVDYEDADIRSRLK